jgi:hypothetical protein
MGGPSMLGPMSDSFAQMDFAFIGQIGSGDEIEKRGFSRSVAADNRYKIPIVDPAIERLHRNHFIDASSIENFCHISDFKHHGSPTNRGASVVPLT